MTVTTTHQKPIAIFVALMAEARVFFDAFRFQNLNDDQFPIFCDRQRPIYMVISGVGRIKMATAVAYFCGRYHADPVLLNVGIAGANAQLDHLFAINKLIDVSSQKNFYPAFSWSLALESTSCQTYDRVCDVYPTVGVMDLEASAFYQSANQFVTRESIRILKCVSDTNLRERNALDKSVVVNIMTKHQLTLCHVVEELWRNALVSCVDDQLYDTIIHQFHVTTYQRHRLRTLCRRYQVLVADRKILHELHALGDIDAVMKHLSNACAKATLRWETV